MRADESVFALHKNQELVVWRTSEDAWSVRIGIRRRGRDKCRAAAELNHEDAKSFAASVHFAADKAFYAMLES